MLARRFLAVAATAALAATLAVPASTPASAAAGAPALAWGACPPPPPGGYPPDPRQQCAQLSVPLDYRKPHGRQITVTVSRIPATDPGSRRGILLSNPGGPGGSGLDLPSMLAQALPAEVQAAYDLIGFDPRGVGASTPISCGLDPATPAELILPYPATDGSIDRNVAFAKSAAASCAAVSGDLLPHITTANTARDMDRIRAALGEGKLSYLGYSYGSYLGAVYTSLFPQRSDRIILDSAVDPNKIWYGVWSQFGPAVALRFPDFAAWAAKRDDLYGLGATPAAVTRTYFDLAATFDRDPLEIPELGITLTGNFFREVTRSYLYDDRNFPFLAVLWQAFAEGTAPAGETLQGVLAEVPADNSTAVLWAIACGDVAWSGNTAMYARNSAVSRRQFPITAGMPANIWPCAFWHYQPVERPVKVTGNGPRNVLIMQNLRDPATGYQGSLGMRRALAGRAAMVTQDAGGHGVYGIRAGECATAIGTAFLVDGVLPARDRFCQGPSPDDVSTLVSVPRISTWPL
jgi:pimeloyl-ACP methyl ester carboxylesterase